MKSKILSVTKYVFLFSIGLGLLWLTFRKEDLSEIATKVSAANPWWLAVSVIISIVALYIRAIRWAMLIRPLGYQPKISSTLYALLLGYFANLAIPRIGEITRCGVLAKSEKVPFNSLIGTVIVERVIDLIMLFLSMVLVAILEYDMLHKFLTEKVVGPIVEKFNFLQNTFVIIGFFILLIFMGWLLWRFSIKKENESALSIKIRGILREVGSGFKTILRMKNTGWFIFHTFFIWFLYFLMTWVCFFCLESTSQLDMKAGMFVLVVGGLGMSAPVQGGIGAYHYIVSQGLQLFGVSPTDGIVYATLVHTTQTLLVVVLGLFAMVMLFITGKKNKINEQT